MNFAGHYYTLSAYVRRSVFPPLAAKALPFSVQVPDARVGTVRLTGYLSEPAAPRGLLIIVHGLGGSADSSYTFRVTQLANERGLASLRLNLRGADMLGEDFYHGGLTSDLFHVMAAPELQRYARIALLGYSLGGHVCLKAATEDAPERLGAVAALCSPLYLADSSRHFDDGVATWYRQHVLSSLKLSYAAFMRRSPQADLPSIERAARIDKIQEWDERVVAPRHGFASAAAYYAEASVGPRLPNLKRNALLLCAPTDPMVALSALQPFAERAGALLDFRTVPGGHLGFPTRCDLGEAGPKDTDAQVLAWLERHAF